MPNYFHIVKIISCQRVYKNVIFKLAGCVNLRVNVSRNCCILNSITRINSYIKCFTVGKIVIMLNLIEQTTLL